MTARQAGSTPLLSLDAVVLDFETTGLDPRKARIVQIGALKLGAGKIIHKETFERLVHPGIPIPATSTRIHGINDAMVANAPRFAESVGALSAFTGSAVMIGHAIGFDLAVWQAESARAGLPFSSPRYLDTRFLAQVANPHLHDYSLEVIAGWLDIATEGRHQALFDAKITAEIFLKLLPLLRDRGIRSLAEAERACTRLSSALEASHEAGWITPTPPEKEEGSGARLLEHMDSYPFRTRVSALMKKPLITASPDELLGAALKKMVAARISALFILPEGSAMQAKEAGIITERDIMRALSAKGAAALDEPVSAFMARPLVTIPEDAFVHRAIGRMSRLGFRHLAAVDEDGRLTGALSARDLLKHRAGSAAALGDAIDAAPDAAALAQAYARLPRLAADLLLEAVPIATISAVISREIGALTRRAAMLAEAEILDEGKGPPPVPYTIVVLGSAGRGDSLLAADQDNAALYTDDGAEEDVDAWFAAFGETLARTLHDAGLPLCKGGVMVKNPAFRGSLARWRARIEEWVRLGRPEDILALDIFFDLRAVTDNNHLARALMEDAYRIAGASLPFLKLLTAELDNYQAPFTLFGGLKVESGRIDLKKFALFPVVTTARVLALRHQVIARGTRERLQGLIEKEIGAAQDLNALINAYDFLQHLVLEQQIHDSEKGRPLDNQVEVARLKKSERQDLKDHLARLRHVPAMTRELLF